jgi:tripartite-type tricarboxylate transporter receptor subunit TctC
MGFFLRAPLLAVFALTAVAAPNAASAQGFPTRPITLVVPAAAGGPTDTVARLIAESMSRTLGQTVVVENVGGAGGTIGMARVAKATPDGYTIAVWHVGQATAPALYDGLKYDVVNDFDHLGRITDVPMTLVSKTPFPANNVTELLAWIKSEAAKASYGHAGIGSASHLCALVLLKELGVQMNGNCLSWHGSSHERPAQRAVRHHVRPDDQYDQSHQRGQDQRLRSDDEIQGVVGSAVADPR